MPAIRTYQRTRGLWPASESRQGTKARGLGTRCGGRYEGLIETATLIMTELISRDEGDGALKRVMPLAFWEQRAPTQPLGAGTDLE